LSIRYPFFHCVGQYLVQSNTKSSTNPQLTANEA